MRLHSAASLCLKLVLFAAPAAAHPHAFIDLRTVLEIDTTGHLTAIRQQWTFDQYYTEFALHDFGYKPGGALDHGKLKELALENLKGLAEFQYFTKLSDAGAKFKPATDVESRLKAKRIVMTFTLPLERPVSAPVTVRIYDPSYYTAMLHIKDGVTVTGNGACTATLTKAQPDAVWATLASSLDRNAKAPDDLGTYFAETVSVACK